LSNGTVVVTTPDDEGRIIHAIRYDASMEQVLEELEGELAETAYGGDSGARVRRFRRWSPRLASWHPAASSTRVGTLREGPACDVRSHSTRRRQPATGCERSNRSSLELSASPRRRSQRSLRSCRSFAP
jgi:hypothetical protein